MVLDRDMPVEQCNMCGHSLIMRGSKHPDESNKTIDCSKIKLYQNDSHTLNLSDLKPESIGELVTPSGGDVQVFAIS